MGKAAQHFFKMRGALSPSTYLPQNKCKTGIFNFYFGVHIVFQQTEI